MTTQSTTEAIALLKATRKNQLQVGRSIARQLIERNGSTYGKAVRSEMIARKLFDFSIPAFWLGALFRNTDFEWTGEYKIPSPDPSDSGRNIHEYNAEKVWRLRTV